MFIARNNSLVALIVAGAVLTAFAVGYRHPWVPIEDGLIETASALGYGFAAVLFAARALRNGSGSSVRTRRVFGTLAALSLLFLLDEISFGARLFALDMPQMTGGGEFDGAHDLIILFGRWIAAAGAAAQIAGGVAAIGLAALAARLLYPRRASLLRGVRIAMARTLPFRVGLAFAALAGAVMLDLSAAHSASILEEVLELAASGLLILAALSTDGEPAGAAAPVSSEARLRQPSRQWSARRPAGTDGPNP